VEIPENSSATNEKTWKHIGQLLQATMIPSNAMPVNLSIMNSHSNTNASVLSDDPKMSYVKSDFDDRFSDPSMFIV